MQRCAAEPGNQRPRFAAGCGSGGCDRPRDRPAPAQRTPALLLRRPQEVCRVANWLRSVGVKKGDSVAIYMPMVCELPIAMVRPAPASAFLFF